MTAAPAVPTAAEPPASVPPTAESPPTAQDEEVYRNVEKVVERAKLGGAWLTAENYLRARVTGEPLDYGLKLLDAAKQEAEAASRRHGAGRVARVRVPLQGHGR